MSENVPTRSDDLDWYQAEAKKADENRKAAHEVFRKYLAGLINRPEKFAERDLGTLVRTADGEVAGTMRFNDSRAHVFFTVTPCGGGITAWVTPTNGKIEYFDVWSDEESELYDSYFEMICPNI